MIKNKFVGFRDGFQMATEKGLHQYNVVYIYMNALCL